MEKKKYKPNPQKSAISNLVKVPSKNDPSSKTFWPREMKMAKVLYNKYPDDDFWLNLKLSYKLNSLAFFRTEKGSKELKNKYNEYIYQPPELEEVPELPKEKIGKDINIQNKPVFLDDL